MNSCRHQYKTNSSHESDKGIVKEEMTVSAKNDSDTIGVEERKLKPVDRHILSVAKILDRPFCWEDFKGRYEHGTIRNAFSRLKKKGLIRLWTRSSVAFYVLPGQVKGYPRRKVTLHHRVGKGGVRGVKIDFGSFLNSLGWVGLSLMKEESNFEQKKQAEILKKALKGTSTTTTDSLCRIRGFTIDLLFLLRYGARRTHELGKITKKNSRYVNIYLKRMWIYGLVEKQRLFWKLTPLGLDLYDYFNNNTILTNKQIRTISNKDKLTYKQHKCNRSTTEVQQKYNTSKLKLPRQLSIDLWQRKSSLDDIEKKVVVVLLDHYNETGSKFFYVLNHYDIAERFGVRPDQVNQVLMNLKEDHIIYTYSDRQHDNAIKIGLTKDFITILKMSAEART